MTFARLDMWSEALGINIPVNVLLPDLMHRKGPPKALYLLHGLSDDESIWCRRTSLERYVGTSNLCVIMPTTRRGFYTNMKRGYAYWTYISAELPRFIHGVFRLSDSPRDTFAAGVSMGGYGAVKLGLRQAERFCRIYSISGALDMDRHRDVLPEFDNVFGPQVPESDNVYSLLEGCAQARRTLPPMRLYCGAQDRFLGDNERFVRQAREYGFAAELSVEPGGHEWNSWDSALRRVIGDICSG